MADRLTWIPDFYSEEYAHFSVDAIVCRHTLEHIAPVGVFLASGEGPGRRWLPARLWHNHMASKRAGPPDLKG